MRVAGGWVILIGQTGRKFLLANTFFGNSQNETFVATTVYAKTKRESVSFVVQVWPLLHVQL